MHTTNYKMPTDYLSMTAAPLDLSAVESTTCIYFCRYAMRAFVFTLLHIWDCKSRSWRSLGTQHANR